MLCGKEFLVAPNRMMSNRGKYCSKTCYYISQRGKVKESSKIKTKCDYCGKDILIHPYKIKDSKNHYCSQACHYKHRETFIGEKSPKYERYDTICSTCGKALKLIKSRFKNSSNNNFCSLSCAAIHRIKFMPNKSTSIERAIKSVLDYLNITYEEQYIVSGFIADFYLPDYNLIIECDGDYWHNRPEQIIKDKRKNAVYKRFGYSLLRLWEHDIKQDALGLITKNLKII